MNLQQELEKKLQHQFPDSSIELKMLTSDGRHMHVTIVSAQFQDLTLLQRHKSVMDLCAPFFQQGLHALKVTAKTPKEIA